MLVAYSPLTLAWVVPIGRACRLARWAVATRSRQVPTICWRRSPRGFGPSARCRRSSRPGRACAGSGRWEMRSSFDFRSAVRHVCGALSPNSVIASTRRLTRRRAGPWPNELRVLGGDPSAGLSALSPALASWLRTRSIWFSGPPEVGFALPPSGLSGLVASYGGGPNPAGFGSDLVVPPVVGLGSICLSSCSAADRIWPPPFCLLAAIALALLGMARLARRMGAGSLAGVRRRLGLRGRGDDGRGRCDRQLARADGCRTLALGDRGDRCSSCPGSSTGRPVGRGRVRRGLCGDRFSAASLVVVARAVCFGPSSPAVSGPLASVSRRLLSAAL